MYRDDLGDLGRLVVGVQDHDQRAFAAVVPLAHQVDRVGGEDGSGLGPRHDGLDRGDGGAGRLVHEVVGLVVAGLARRLEPAGLALGEQEQRQPSGGRVAEVGLGLASAPGKRTVVLRSTTTWPPDATNSSIARRDSGGGSAVCPTINSTW